MLGVKRGATKYELLLLFERFKLMKPYDIWKKLRDRYSMATIYRYHRHWVEADMTVQVISKDLFKEKA
jgi:hypothetical protein